MEINQRFCAANRATSRNAVKVGGHIPTAIEGEITAEHHQAIADFLRILGVLKTQKPRFGMERRVGIRHLNWNEGIFVISKQIARGIWHLDLAGLMINRQLAGCFADSMQQVNFIAFDISFKRLGKMKRDGDRKQRIEVETIGRGDGPIEPILWRWYQQLAIVEAILFNVQHLGLPPHSCRGQHLRLVSAPGQSDN